MRVWILAAAALFVGGAAHAEQPARSSDARADGREGARVVFICDRTQEGRRSFEREHGRLTFVSAEELARAQAERQRWSAPRCITSSELQRYEANVSEPPLMHTSRRN